MSTVIETKLLISGQDAGAQRSVEAISKALKELGEAAKVSEKVDRLAKSLLETEKAQKAVTAAMKAEAGLKDANARLRATSDAAKALAGEYDRARKAAEAFKGVKIEKGSDQARAAKDAANAVREAGRAYRGAEADVRKATAAVSAQMSAFQGANRAAVALGAPINRLADHQRKLAGSINQTTQALLRQEAAEKRVAAAAQQAAARRTGRREALGVIAGGAGLVAASKGKKIGLDAVQSAADFDLAVRKQKVYTDIGPDDQKRLLAQAKQIGQETQFSNIDVVKAQTAAMQGLPAGYSSSTRAQVAEGIVGNVRNYSTLMDTDLKSGAETLRGYLQQTGKDISTGPKALFEANKATNQLVKMAKLGGMDGEDVAQFAKFAASSATAAGLSTDTTLTLGALARRGGLRGDEAGTFIRSTAGKLVSPTQPGLTALSAAGIDFNKYVSMPERLSTEGLEAEFQRKMGKSFTPEIRSKLEAINSDASLIGDRGKYSTAVTGAVGDLLGKDKKGGVRAIDSAKAARIAGAFQKVSAKSVDTERLLGDVFDSNMTLPQLNAFLTDKHGGKGAITQRQYDEFKQARTEIGKAGQDPNFAKDKADYVYAGLGGSVENLKGSFENFVLQIGTANEGLIKFTADGIGKGIDAFSNLSQTSQQVLSLVGGGAAVGGGVYGAVKVGGKLLGMGGGAGLTGSAVALTHSAALLDAAAIKLAGGSVVGDVVKGGTAAAGTAGALTAFGLGGIGLGLGAGAGVAIAGAAKMNPELMRERGPGGFDPATGGTTDANPMAGMAPATPVGKEWWLKNMPTFLGGEAGSAAGKAAGDGVAKGIEEKGPDVEEKGKTLYEKLKNIFSEGIKIPIDFASAEGGGGGSGGGMGGLIQKASFGSSGDGAIGGVTAGGAIGGAAPMGRGGGVGGGGSRRGVASGGGGVRGNEDPDVVAYIRDSAVRNGIDPGTAVAVARTEGLGGSSKTRNTPGDYAGGKPTSFGPFQLHYGSGGRGMSQKGLGNAYTRETGNHASDATHWKEQIDFALRTARKSGWGQWYGARNNGIGNMQGIGRPVPKGAPGETEERARTMQKTLPPKQPDVSATELRAATENLKAISINSHHSVEVSAKPGSSARTVGMRSSASGPIKADTGVSMPQAQARDGDWV